MENEKNQAPELSIQKYAIARLLLYITLLVIIVFFFIPVIPVGEYSKISVFQFYTVDFSWVAIAGTFQAQWISICRIFGIIGGLFVALFVFLVRKSTVKNKNKAFNTAGQQSLANRLYMAQVYGTLPRGINALQSCLCMMFEMACFGSIAFIYNPSDLSSNYTIFITCMLPIVIGMILFKNPIAWLICGKDFRLINEESARFNNEKIESPTIISDFHFIGMLFGASENSSSNQNVTDVTETLREYKKLLDDGIITEEEFQAKKAELLHTSNDQKSE